jgi:hypothetical protein
LNFGRPLGRIRVLVSCRNVRKSLRIQYALAIRKHYYLFIICILVTFLLCCYGRGPEANPQFFAKVRSRVYTGSYGTVEIAMSRVFSDLRRRCKRRTVQYGTALLASYFSSVTYGHRTEKQGGRGVDRVRDQTGCYPLMIGTEGSSRFATKTNLMKRLD